MTSNANIRVERVASELSVWNAISFWIQLHTFPGSTFVIRRTCTFGVEVMRFVVDFKVSSGFRISIIESIIYCAELVYCVLRDTRKLMQ